MHVLVTGSNGFIGRSICERIEREGFSVRRLIRDKLQNPSINKSKKIFENNKWLINNIGPETNWEYILDDIDAVIHLAGRAHILHETEDDPLSAFRHVNTRGTAELATVAAEKGIKRFIYISSIGVNGCQTFAHPFHELDTPNPHNDYAVSKWEAEQILFEISKKTGMEVVAVRPPLVYGPRVKANFLNMMHWLHSGVPLPFGAINNKRSLVALDNLVDLVMTCIDHPAAANQTFNVGDGEDLSTAELLKRLGGALGKPARLLSVPPNLLKIGLKMLGKMDVAQKLCSSLQVDISKARNVLGWEPSVSVDEGLKKTAEWYKNRAKD